MRYVKSNDKDKIWLVLDAYDDTYTVGWYYFRLNTSPGTLTSSFQIPYTFSINTEMMPAMVDVTKQPMYNKIDLTTYKWLTRGPHNLIITLMLTLSLTLLTSHIR